MSQEAVGIQTSPCKCSPGFGENSLELVMFELSLEGEVRGVWGGEYCSWLGKCTGCLHLEEDGRKGGRKEAGEASGSQNTLRTLDLILQVKGFR